MCDELGKITFHRYRCYDESQSPPYMCGCSKLNVTSVKGRISEYHPNTLGIYNFVSGAVKSFVSFLYWHILWYYYSISIFPVFAQTRTKWDSLLQFSRRKMAFPIIFTGEWIKYFSLDKYIA